MEIEKDLFDSIKGTVDLDEDEKVICCVNVETFLKRNKKGKGCMLITEFGFYLLEKGPFSKAYSISGQFFWNRLNTFELIESENILFFSCDIGCFKVKHHGAAYFAKLIATHLKNQLIQSELPKFVGIDVDEIEHKHEAFLNRFRFLRRIANLRKTPSHLEKELSKIICRTHTLDITDLPKSTNYAEILLDCLQIEPTITAVILPRGEQCSFWTSLANCLKRNTTLNHIVTKDKANNDLSLVAEALQSNQENNICKITFIGAEFNNEHFPILQKMFSSIPFQSIEFDKSISGKLFQQFMTYPSMGLALASLQSFTLKNTKELPVEIVFKMLPSLKCLSLIDCNVNLDDVSKLIPNYKKLESITIKGGFATKQFQLSAFQSTLDSFSFKNIQWNEQSFFKIWNVVMSHQPKTQKLTISFSNAELSRNDWNQFYTQLRGHAGSPYLTSFTWSDNEVQPALFQYLANCNQLKTLVFNGCFNGNSSTIINTLTDFLNSKPIERLSIMGTKHGQLCESSIALFSKLKKNQYLQYLNVSKNKIGDNGLKALGDFLVANKKLNEIIFTDSNIKTGDTFIKFFDTVINRGPKLNMEWPEKDIHKMHKAKLLRSSNINHMMDCHAIIMNGNLKVKVSEEVEEGEDVNSLFEEPKRRSSDHSVRKGPTRSSSIVHRHRRNSKQQRGDIQIPEAKSDDNSDSVLYGSEASTSYNQDAWNFTIPEIPYPNIQEQIHEIDSTYSLNALLQRMR